MQLGVQQQQRVLMDRKGWAEQRDVSPKSVVLLAIPEDGKLAAATEPVFRVVVKRLDDDPARRPLATGDGKAEPPRRRRDYSAATEQHQQQPLSVTIRGVSWLGALERLKMTVPYNASPSLLPLQELVRLKQLLVSPVARGAAAAARGVRRLSHVELRALEALKCPPNWVTFIRAPALRSLYVPPAVYRSPRSLGLTREQVQHPLTRIRENYPELRNLLICDAPQVSFLNFERYGDSSKSDPITEHLPLHAHLPLLERLCIRAHVLPTFAVASRFPALKEVELFMETAGGLDIEQLGVTYFAYTECRRVSFRGFSDIGGVAREAFGGEDKAESRERGASGAGGGDGEEEEEFGLSSGAQLMVKWRELRLPFCTVLQRAILRRIVFSEGVNVVIIAGAHRHDDNTFFCPCTGVVRIRKSELGITGRLTLWIEGRRELYDTDADVIYNTMGASPYKAPEGLYERMMLESGEVPETD